MHFLHLYITVNTGFSGNIIIYFYAIYFFTQLLYFHQTVLILIRIFHLLHFAYNSK
jgi:hypothetical protein